MCDTFVDKQITKDFGFGTQIRRSPYFKSTLKWGAVGFSVYNHMYIPRDFGDPRQNFWNLVNSAILCDVAVERQVEITGPDAAKFTQLLTGRNLEKCEVGQCKYVLITNAAGGLLNDPVLLKLGENHFWLSLSDSDIILWAQGVQVNSDLKVSIVEPDVSPLQLQGPNSLKIMKALFGERISNLKYYRFFETELDGIPLVVARTGWSSELGYEFFLRDSSKGDALWERVMGAGAQYDLKAGHTSTIRRVEAAMLSYHADADINTNPFELGLDRLIDLEMEAEFIGKRALIKIAERGVHRKQVGVILDGAPIDNPNSVHWSIEGSDGEIIGKITSAIYSPRLEKNIALGIIQIGESKIGNEILVNACHGRLKGKIVQKPFFDPQKLIARR
ncbi:MAG: glycine cleavage T C-terminal barrel domain-containing protein [Pseudomonadota bacterium]|nr:glycine cleavage T C-terminal barrel domain-containing protein [Pseudomonadota bacterium]